MVSVAPSVLSADFANLGRELAVIKESGARWVHVDVMDGSFVPNFSIGTPVVQCIREHTDLIMDVHLMVTKPGRHVERFCGLGADYLSIHMEADTQENILAALERIRALGVKPGIVMKPKTPAEAALPFLDKVDMIVVMTVEPGFGGQKFMVDMMPKLKKLREMLDEVNPGCLLEVDGGVDASTCETCKENGANVLVTGSAYFGTEDKAAFVKALEA